MAHSIGITLVRLRFQILITWLTPCRFTSDVCVWSHRHRKVYDDDTLCAVVVGCCHRRTDAVVTYKMRLMNVAAVIDSASVHVVLVIDNNHIGRFAYYYYYFFGFYLRYSLDAIIWHTACTICEQNDNEKNRK